MVILDRPVAGGAVYSETLPPRQAHCADGQEWPSYANLNRWLLPELVASPIVLACGTLALLDFPVLTARSLSRSIIVTCHIGVRKGPPMRSPSGRRMRGHRHGLMRSSNYDRSGRERIQPRGLNPIGKCLQDSKRGESTVGSMKAMEAASVTNVTPSSC